MCVKLIKLRGFILFPLALIRGVSKLQTWLPPNSSSCQIIILSSSREPSTYALGPASVKAVGRYAALGKKMKTPFVSIKWAHIETLPVVHQESTIFPNCGVIFKARDLHV